MLRKESFSGFVIKLWVVNNKSIFSKQLPVGCHQNCDIQFDVTSWWVLPYSMHLKISQFPDLTASNNIDVPKISDTIFGDLQLNFFTNNKKRRIQ